MQSILQHLTPMSNYLLLPLLFFDTFQYAKAAIDQPLLFCEADRIYVNITRKYLRQHRIEIQDARQLHFGGHPACYAAEQGNAYILTLYEFERCGTHLDHDTEDYIYTNQVVLDRKDGNGPTKLLEMRCVYEDQYIVSSGPIRPTKNTLSFTTEYGNFETTMELYDNQRFDSLAKLDDRPTIMLGQKVFISVSMFVPFNPDYANDFTITLMSCFASDNPTHTIMERYHYLITGMCASPDDNTVSIFQNGKAYQTEAKFAFDMFRFRKGLDYIYLHCEVKLCNSTMEICEGNTPNCNGLELEDKSSRKKRSSLPNTYGPEFFDDFHSETVRRKRAIDDDMPDPEDATLAYLSRGPLILATNERKATDQGITTVFDDDLERRSQDFLRLWVCSGVSAIVGVVGIILTVFTVIRRRTEQTKLQQNGTVIRVEAPALKGGVVPGRQGPLPPIPPGSQGNSQPPPPYTSSQ